MNKDELQLKVQNLETLLTSKEQETTTLNTQLSQARKVLADVSKPIITKEIVEEIREAVHQALRQISFDSVESYDVDFEIDYNNSLALANIEFNEVDEIEETVCDYVENIFNVA